ncbi:solute carrier family 22 member 6-A-like [Anolis carolinensis]|uniref:solute carrier family 22 member 6-A-like n=1 Tax=Anolis carolinensis TaxID=28377 RepID=UPI002F2B8356
MPRRLSLCPGPTVAPVPFGDLLEEVGSTGLFQLFSTVLLSIPVLLLASHNLVQNFSAASPEHRCHLVQLNASRIGQDAQSDICQSFVIRQSSPDANGSTPCHNGWEYDRSVFTSTIVTEWDLVCHLQSLKSLAQSLFMAGVLVGAFILGDLSDRFGRRLILIWSLLLVAVMGCAAAFSQNFAAYCVFRFLSGVGISGFLLNYICLSLEWVPTKHRATVVSAQSYCSTAGQLLLAGLAYGIRNWRWLQLAISAPFFCFFAYSWWLPESARWLLMNNEHEAALRNLKLVARINGKAAAGNKVVLEVGEIQQINVEAHVFVVQIGFANKRPLSSQMLETQRGGKSPHSCLDLFRTPGLRRISCCLMFVSFSMNMSYFGLAMELSVFGLNVFLVQLFFGAIDLVAKMACALMLTFFGRRTIQAVSLILAGTFLLLSLPVPAEMSMVRLSFVVLGKGCLASASMCLYLYGGELFPTVIRQTGTSFLTVMARLGGIVAPVVLMAGSYQPFLPLLIFGVTPIISGVCAGFLPEMLNVPLLDTVEEVEERARQKSKGQTRKIEVHIISSTRL